MSVAVAAAGMVVFLAAAVLTYTVGRHTERRLLDRQTAQAGTVLGSAADGLQAVLSAGVQVAEATDGDVERFRAALGPLTGSGLEFASASLWASGSDGVQLLGTLGAPSNLAASGDERARSALTAAQANPGLTVVGIIAGDGDRVGYAFRSPGADSTFLIYAESPLPADRRSVHRSGEAFADLDYAVYLGAAETDDALLFSSVQALPITGHRSTIDVPFGNTVLHVVMTPRTPLTGTLAVALPWIVGSVGVLISLIAGGLTERLLWRRDQSSRLATDIEQLYNEQRGIAETLQRSLLPDVLPHLDGAELTARYWPAGSASDVGGDFYDVFPLGERRWGLTIGDVCGKGIEAAAITGIVRHTIQAAARHVSSPSEVLRWVHDALRSKNIGTYCTVCYGVLTLDGEGRATLVLSLGGHPQPLLLRADGRTEEIGAFGTVLGLDGVEPDLRDTTYALAPHDKLLMFTDGLTDTAGDTSVPLEQLARFHADTTDSSAEDVADGIRSMIEQRRPIGSGDDTALLIVHLVGHAETPAVEPAQRDLAAQPIT